MSSPTRTVLALMAVTVACFALLCGVTIVGPAPLQAVQTEPAEPAPPEGQTYTGAKECAACHFKQFMSWKKDKHSKSFQLLPEEYQPNAECVKCHSTGLGEETGFKDLESTPNLAGTTCESCHGPGSKHAEICQGFGKEKLNAEQEKIARDSIWSMLPENVCVACHITKAHEKSKTPKELQTKK